MRTLALVALAFSIAACAQFPEIEGATSAQAKASDYPKLVPLAPLLGQYAAPQTDPVETQEQLQSRVSRLQARANALRGVVPGGTERPDLEEKQ